MNIGHFDTRRHVNVNPDQVEQRSFTCPMIADVAVRRVSNNEYPLVIASLRCQPKWRL